MVKNTDEQLLSGSPEATRKVELIFALSHVTSSAKACSSQDDESMFRVFEDYYALAANEVGGAKGRVVKTLGDEVLMIFPPEDPEKALESLRAFQNKANEMWHKLDSRCRIQVKAGRGMVVSGMLGVPGEERFDIVGDCLNELFQTTWSDFVVLPELAGPG